jgi:hypothetical protein
MRLFEIARAEKLTKAEARSVFQEIETGRGGIAVLAAKKPFLSRLSRDALADRGPGLRLFRAVAVYDALKPDAVVSTTLDWRVAHGIGADFPLLMGHGSWSPAVHLLRYDVPLDRVVGYLPVLVTLALETLGPGAADQKITDRFGDRTPIQRCLDMARREQEVVADLSGLRPEVLAFEFHVKGRGFYHAMDHIANGTFRNARQYLEAHRGQGFGGLYGDETEWDAHAAAVRHFLRGEPHPDVLT